MNSLTLYTGLKLFIRSTTTCLYSVICRNELPLEVGKN